MTYIDLFARVPEVLAATDVPNPELSDLKFRSGAMSVYHSEQALLAHQKGDQRFYFECLSVATSCLVWLQACRQDQTAYENGETLTPWEHDWEVPHAPFERTA